MYVIIIGCGRVGSELAKLLADAGHNVVVIDKNADSFKQLGADFNGLTITGNGFDVDLLKEAGVDQADAFCTVTDNDNANIMSGQVAKKIFHISKVITRINDAQYAHLYKELGIDIVNSTTLLASEIRNKIQESRFSSFFLEDARLNVMEIETGPKSVGKAVEELNLPGELLITAIRKKNNNLVIASTRDIVKQGDLLLAVVKTESLAKVKKLLGLVKGT
ncbi:MAG: TrkA family potassium uptake protein [Candidatus Omnitrophica bacterium]|nr:TrkA family potassium uptake protein [Candidatus Omnitrophota bacterium]